jgi:hypothetical protein
MKQIIGKTIMLVAVAAALVSFTNFGGEGLRDIPKQQSGNAAIWRIHEYRLRACG